MLNSCDCWATPFRPRNWFGRCVAGSTRFYLDVAYRMSLMSQAAETKESEWLAPLNISGTLYPFEGRYSTVTARDVMMTMPCESAVSPVSEGASTLFSGYT